MRRRMAICVVGGGLLGAWAGWPVGAAGTEVGAPAVADRAISVRALRADAEFLASDALEGRDTGTRGYDIAARFAATRFAEFGLEPGGEAGSYLQAVPFVAATVVEQSLRVAGQAPAPAAATPLVWKEDYVLSSSASHPEATVDAPVVFVGFGVDAPELGHRDYEGVDVRGKVALLLTGAPAGFPVDQRAHYSSRRNKAQEASRRGAVGVLQVATRIDDRRGPWGRMTLNAGRPDFAWRHPAPPAAGAPHAGMLEDPAPNLRFMARLSHAGAAKLLAGTDLPLEALLDAGEKLDYRPRELNVRLEARLRVVLRDLSSPNVVGVLRGADPALAGEWVVVTAHLDHVGVGAEVGGDAIYNGFYDNAMGSAVVIEMARRLAGAEARPRRSIAFVLVTGEEKGLLGSDFFARYPGAVIAAGAIVANVNIDMPLLLEPLADLVALGAEHSSLGTLAQEAAAAHGFRLSPDPEPEEVYFVRSDQYSFIRQGIPSIVLDAGIATLSVGPTPQDAQAKATEGFRTEHYHRPSDEVELGADWDAVARYAATNARLIELVANAAERPRWVAGDFFAGKFARP